MVDLVIRNLVSNAMKFTPNGGTVTVTVAAENGRCMFSVQDTGRGIPNEQIAKLLDPDTTMTTPGTNNEKGTGLGLVICTEMISMLNGTIDIQSELDQGTVFTVSLPKYT